MIVYFLCHDSCSGHNFSPRASILINFFDRKLIMCRCALYIVEPINGRPHLRVKKVEKPVFSTGFTGFLKKTTLKNLWIAMKVGIYRFSYTLMTILALAFRSDEILARYWLYLAKLSQMNLIEPKVVRVQ